MSDQQSLSVMIHQSDSPIIPRNSPRLCKDWAHWFRPQFHGQVRQDTVAFSAAITACERGPWQALGLERFKCPVCWMVVLKVFNPQYRKDTSPMRHAKIQMDCDSMSTFGTLTWNHMDPDWQRFKAGAINKFYGTPSQNPQIFPASGPPDSKRRQSMARSLEPPGYHATCRCAAWCGCLECCHECLWELRGVPPLNGWRG